MDPKNSPLSGSAELFLKDAVRKDIEKSSQVGLLHDEAILKAVSQDKPVKKPAK